MAHHIDWANYFTEKIAVDLARDRVAKIGQKRNPSQGDLDKLDQLLGEIDEAELTLRNVEDRLRRR